MLIVTFGMRGRVLVGERLPQAAGPGRCSGCGTSRSRPAAPESACGDGAQYGCRWTARPELQHRAPSGTSAAIGARRCASLPARDRPRTANVAVNAVHAAAHVVARSSRSMLSSDWPPPPKVAKHRSDSFRSWISSDAPRQARQCPTVAVELARARSSSKLSNARRSRYTRAHDLDARPDADGSAATGRPRRRSSRAGRRVRADGVEGHQRSLGRRAGDPPPGRGGHPQHGYRRSGRRARSAPILELIFHELESEWALEIVRGVERVAGRHQLAVVLSEMQGRRTPGRGWIEGVLARRPTGVIAVFSDLSEIDARPAPDARHPARGRSTRPASRSTTRRRSGPRTGTAA